MKVAEELLKETNDSIADIAYAIGYSSSQSFTKAFKRFFKETPAQYKKKSAVH